MDMIGFILYYIIGLVGAGIGLLVLVSILHSCIEAKKSNKNTTKLDEFIVKLYNRIGINYDEFDFSTSKIDIVVAFWLGLYAVLGPYALLISFITGVMSSFIIMFSQISNRQ